MRRQLGDLVAQPVQFRDGFGGGVDGCRVAVHGAPPSYPGATLHPVLGGTLGRSGPAIRDGEMIFASAVHAPPSRDARGPLEPTSAGDCRLSTVPPGRDCQAETSRLATWRMAG